MSRDHHITFNIAVDHFNLTHFDLHDWLCVLTMFIKDEVTSLSFQANHRASFTSAFIVYQYFQHDSNLRESPGLFHTIDWMDE